MSYSDIVSRTVLVKRFNGQRIVGERMSIAEHQYEVALYGSMFFQDHEVKKALNEFLGHSDSYSSLNALELEVMKHCLVHDIPEVYTSDIPYPIKAKSPKLKEALDEVEEIIVDSFPSSLKALYKVSDPMTLSILKILDIIAVVREINDEHKYGNIIQPKGVKNITLELFNNLLNKEYGNHHAIALERLVEIAYSFMYEKLDIDFEG